MILPVCQRLLLLSTPCIPTKRRMCRRIFIKRIDTYYLVVCTRCQIFAVGREADGVDGARMMAYGGELFGFRVRGIV